MTEVFFNIYPRYDDAAELYRDAVKKKRWKVAQEWFDSMKQQDLELARLGEP